MTAANQLLLYCTGGFVLISILAFFFKPFRLIIKGVFQSFLGFLGLIAINFTGQFIGITLGLNIINSIILGILGLPGLGVLLILQWLY